MLVYVHKEDEFDDIDTLPAERYVLVDDKVRILAAAMEHWDERVTTVLPMQGQFANDADRRSPRTRRPQSPGSSIGDLRPPGTAPWIRSGEEGRGGSGSRARGGRDAGRARDGLDGSRTSCRLLPEGVVVALRRDVPPRQARARELGIWSRRSCDTDAPELDVGDRRRRSGRAVGMGGEGRGAAHTREKAVAAAAACRFVVIVSSDKLVERLTPPVPLELLEFGLAATLANGRVDATSVTPREPDGGVIADYTGALDDPQRSRRGCPRRPESSSTACSRLSSYSDLVVGHSGKAEHRPLR